MSSSDRNILPFVGPELPKAASELLQRSELTLEPSQFWAVLNILPIAVMISRDRFCTNIEGNAASCALLRVSPGQNLSRSAPPGEKPPFQVYVNGEVVAAEQLPMQRAAATGKPVIQSECEIRFDDGASVFLAGYSIPVFDRDGEVCGSIGTFADITQRKRLEQQNDLLSCELGHRIKNTVAVIQSIARQTIRPLLSPADFASFDNRLLAFSHAHEMLFQGPGQPASLSDLLQAALKPVLGESPPNVRLNGPAVLLSRAALTVVLILHELTTNALKYGALTEAKGLVEIDWRLESVGLSQLIAIDWKESGGPTVSGPTQRGFGTKLIEAAGKGIKGCQIKTDYAPSGLTCSIQLPLSRPKAV